MNGPDQRWKDLYKVGARQPVGVAEALASRAAAKQGSGSAPGGAKLSLGEPEGVVGRAERRRREAAGLDPNDRGGHFARRQTAGGYFLASLFYFFAGILMLIDPLASMLGWVVRRPRRLVPPPARAE